MKAYRRALSVVALKGPTCFAPSIQMAASFAADHFHKQEQKYHVLLIITDGKHFIFSLNGNDCLPFLFLFFFFFYKLGIIDDLQETIEEIVAASHLGLYIVIVGVGDADFSKMDILCGVGGPLRNAKQQSALQNIVQVHPSLTLSLTHNNPTSVRGTLRTQGQIT